MNKLIRLGLGVLFMLITVSVRAELKPYPLDTIDGQVVYRYHAEKSVGLYRISVNFGCSQADIIRLNPQLKERGLHVDELLYLPVPAEDLVNVQSTKDVQRDNVQSTKDVQGASDKGQVTGEFITSDSITSEAITSEAINLALLLPLQAGALERTAQMDRFIDFYEGALIALYEAQERGEQIDLKVYDTNKSATEVAHILASGELDDRQVVIGPAYPAPVAKAAAWAQEHQITLVVPFSTHVPEMESNPYLIRFNTTAEIETDSMMAWLSREQVRPVFVESKEADRPESIRLLKQKVEEAGIESASTSIHAILSDSLFTSLAPGRKNLLVLNTEKFQNISILLPAIERAAKDSNLILYTHYAWPVERIHVPSCHVSVFATDHPADRSHYEALYERYFHHSHASLRPRYDLLGYDLIRLTLTRLRGTEYRGLQSDIRLQQIGEHGGWQNTYIQIVTD